MRERQFNQNQLPAKHEAGLYPNKKTGMTDVIPANLSVVIKLLRQRLEYHLNGHAPFEARVHIIRLNADGVDHIAALHER